MSSKELSNRIFGFICISTGLTGIGLSLFGVIPLWMLLLTAPTYVLGQTYWSSVDGYDPNGLLPSGEPGPEDEEPDEDDFV